ncbi:MAG: HEAT repeat domain-containing protein [Planctomycetota bacterium]
MKNLMFSAWLTPGLVCLAAIGPATPALQAQDAAPQVQEGSAPQVSDTVEAPRLLVLRNGSVLRVRARHSESGWEILSGKSDWKSLGEGTVVRAILERDALADAKRLEQQLSTGPRQEQNTRRVGLAEWMSRQGLMSEALSQLDRVLAADPDQRQALVLMNQLAPQLGFDAIDNAMAGDDPISGVLRAAANGTSTVREIAIQRLASGGATDALRSGLRGQLTSHSPRLRALAALALRRIFPGKSLRMDDVKQLISCSVLDGSEEVRVEAARALRDVQDPNVTGPALKALNSSNPKLRENSIQALGVMGYPAAVEPLMGYLTRVNAAVQSGKSAGVGGGSIFIGKQTAYIQDFDVEVANSSSVADPQINVLIEGSVLDARVIGSYVVSFATEARLVRSSLANLTGADFGTSNRDWFTWWEANRAKWGAPDSKGGETQSSPSAQR